MLARYKGPELDYVALGIDKKTREIEKARLRS